MLQMSLQMSWDGPLRADPAIKFFCDQTEENDRPSVNYARDSMVDCRMGFLRYGDLAYESI